MNISCIVQALLAAMAAGAQQTEPLFECGFDTEEEVAAWRTFRETDKLRWLSRAENEHDVKGGDGAVCMSFTPGQGTFPAIFRDLELIEPVGAVDLWVKVDRTTQVMVSLVERAEGENGTPRRGEAFSVQFHADGGKWTRATIPVSDFSRDPSSPVGDSRLDPAKLGGIAILDGLAVFAPTGETTTKFLGDHTGPQRIVLDEFRVLGAGDTTELPRPAGTVDSFDRNYLSWVPMVGVEIERSPMQGSTSGYGLTARYTRAAGILPAVARPIQQPLTGSELGFRVRASGPIRLQIGLEDHDGARWQRRIEVQGTKGETVWLALSGFKPSEDSKLRDRAATFERLKLITILDATTDAGPAWFQVGDLVVR
ncbi:MAG: hypothetical protein HRF45_13390 [Fimbriimonadia bacterium]|jgi:hypothetical protein